MNVQEANWEELADRVAVEESLRVNILDQIENATLCAEEYKLWQSCLRGLGKLSEFYKKQGFQTKNI